MAVRVDRALTGLHAGVTDHPSPLFPAGLLRSEPAAGPFKAAIAPRSGRNPADLGKAGPRPAQGPVKNWPRLVRKPASLAWQGPDPEASSFRWFLSTAPAGKTGRGPDHLKGIARKVSSMSSSTRSPKSKARIVPLRKGTTLEMVRLCCPDGNQAALISESFGLPVLDSDGIRDFHQRSLIEGADTLSEGLSDKAMHIHLQRIVGSYVGSAYGAGQFYSKAVTEAKDATAKLANDIRDEDLDGPVGFDSNAQRKREFAADMGLQSHALRMAAEGAVAAYEHIVGETWKPYERQVENPGQTVSRQAADLQMAALG